MPHTGTETPGPCPPQHPAHFSTLLAPASCSPGPLPAMAPAHPSILPTLAPACPSVLPTPAPACPIGQHSRSAGSMGATWEVALPCSRVSLTRWAKRARQGSREPTATAGERAHVSAPAGTAHPAHKCRSCPFPPAQPLPGAAGSHLRDWKGICRVRPAAAPRTRRLPASWTGGNLQADSRHDSNAGHPCVRHGCSPPLARPLSAAGTAQGRAGRGAVHRGGLG